MLKRFDEVLHEVEQERQRVDEGLRDALRPGSYVSRGSDLCFWGGCYYSSALYCERRVNDANGSRSAVTQSAQSAQRADPAQNAEQESPHCAIRSGALRSKGPAACRWTPLGVDEEPPHPTSDAALAPPPVSLGDVCFTQ